MLLHRVFRQASNVQFNCFSGNGVVRSSHSGGRNPRSCTREISHKASGPDSMLACTVYVSEGRNLQLIQGFEAIAMSSPKVALVNQFIDEPYHRTSYTLASPVASEIERVASLITKAAIQAVDLREHQASHPRLGAVDHISCHPIGSSSSLEDAALLARAIAAAVGEEPVAAPVFLYGAAEKNGRRLDDLRRSFGYFKGSGAGTWTGSIESSSCDMVADQGPEAIQDRTGIVAIGATPWIVNFNVLLDSSDLSLGRSIARAVSERGGGLPHVQAMALMHTADQVEVACNLLQYKLSSPEAVRSLVKKLAEERGTMIASSYCIGKTPEDMVELASQLTGPAGSTCVR